MAESNKKDKNPDDPSDDKQSRRSFLGRLWAVLGIIAAIEFVTVIISFLSHGKAGKKDDEPLIIEAGRADSFSANSVTANIQGRFYLSRLEDGGFLALSSRCTHLGCAVPWIDKEKRFVCPCHGSTFDPAGNVTSPPAPRPLNIYPVTIENNIVRVNVSKTMQRSRFLKDQIVYAKKGLK